MKRLDKLRKRYLTTRNEDHKHAWHKAINQKYKTLSAEGKEAFFTLEEIAEILEDKHGNTKTLFHALHSLCLKLKSNPSGDFHSECVCRNLPALVQEEMMLKAFTMHEQYETVISIWELWLENLRMKRFATEDLFWRLNGLWDHYCCSLTWCKFAKLLAIYPNHELFDETTMENFMTLMNEAKENANTDCIKDCDIFIGRVLKSNIEEKLKTDLKKMRTEIIDDAPRMYSVSCVYCGKCDVKFSCLCGFAHYCNRSHQKKHWQTHRISCTFKNN